MLSLAFFYWLVDIKKQRKWTKMFVIVGMNSIFIYLFAEVLGHRWLSGFVQIFNDGFLGVLGLPTEALAVTNAISSVIIVGALIAAGPAEWNLAKSFGFIAVVLASVNIFGGFIVTQRMLQMFRQKR